MKAKSEHHVDDKSNFRSLILTGSTPMELSSMTRKDSASEGGAESSANFDAPAKEATESPTGVVWQWPSFFLVQRSSSADDPGAPEHPLFVAPSQAGLEFLESLDQVQSIWIVRTTREGLLRTETVKHLCLWRLAAGDGDTYLTALLCESGAMFIVDGEQAYEVDEVSRKWIAGGKFKSSHSLRDMGAVSSTGS
jgi:hypothetical protein